MPPKDWGKKVISDLGKVVTGNTPDPSDANNYGGDIQFATPGDLRSSKYIDCTERTLTEQGARIARVLPANSVLVTCIGSSIGKVAISRQRCATNQQINAVVVNDRHDPSFIYYQLAKLAPRLSKLAGNQAVPLLNKSTFAAQEICVPSSRLEESAIAKIVGVWDDAIAVTEALLANRRNQNNALARMLFRRWRKSGLAHASWGFVDFDEVFERVARKNTLGNSNVLTISGEYGLISQSEYFKKSVASANLAGYTLLLRGEFAYNKSYSAGYPMGAIKPLTRYDAGVVSSLYVCFRFRDGVEVDRDFFRHYFEAGLLNDELNGIAQEGARNHGLLNVGVGDFFKLRLHIPAVEEQRRIASILNAAESEERLVSEQIRILRNEKQALMQQLLTGKRRVHLPQPAEAANP